MCPALLFFSIKCLPQGYNSSFLLGYQAKAKMSFTDTSYSILSEVRTIPFMYTQGNISDENGNILMSSNGYFVANSTGDTMLYGSGLNPNQCTYDYGHEWGMPIAYGNMFLPMPDDSNKYILFHETCDYNSPTAIDNNFYYSVVDITLDNGLGAVISKNNIAHTDMFGWGMTACKHGNGRDWWIITISDDGSLIHEFLLTPNGVNYVGVKNLQLQTGLGWAGQPVFSPDGKKFAFRDGYVQGTYWNLYINIMRFDRCSGDFVLDTVINYSDSTIGYGTMFSPDSRYLYFSTSEHIYQVDTDTPNIGATLQTVATNDIFPSTVPPFYTNFHLMYLAANGKIYISSTSSVKHLHEINYPDSAGMACDVQLHNIFTDCYFIGVPNHPNYYLGREIGSSCDTLTSVSYLEQHDFKFRVYPNPVRNGILNVGYLLPQNKQGLFEIYDVTGKVVFRYTLPPWSNVQSFKLPKLSNGVYNAVIISGDKRVSKRFAVME